MERHFTAERLENLRKIFLLLVPLVYAAVLSFYRDDNAKEIDVFVEENGYIHPLEIKKSANPERKEVRKFSVIEKTSLKQGSGGIVCMFPYPFPIDRTNSLIPSNLI